MNVAARDVEAALELCRDAAQRAAPISVSLGPAATFWPAAPVIYLAVEGDLAPMDELRADLCTGPLAGPPRERERPFVPHVTLDQRAAPASIPTAVSVLNAYRITYIFATVTLLEQDQDKRWVPAASFPLGGTRVVGRGGLELELDVVAKLDEVAARFAADEWEAYSLARYGPIFRPDDPFAVVARREEAVVGVASGEVRGSVCELARLIVGQAVRGQGIGSHLLRSVERLAGERNCERVRLRTIAGGDAEMFYASRGYLVEATLPAWREGRDFVVMSRPVTGVSRPS